MALFSLFSGSRHEPGNALLNWCGDPGGEIVDYATNYRAAAMALVSLHERRGDSCIDHAALPIVFLYRHAFELYLKAIVYRSALLTIGREELKRALPRLWREHSLVRLASMGRPALCAEGHPLTGNGDLYANIIALASRLDEVDSGSYAFRYPVTSQGASSLPKNVWINIYVFSEVMEAALDDVAQFCRCLRDEVLRTSEQMKLALHPLMPGSRTERT